MNELPPAERALEVHDPVPRSWDMVEVSERRAGRGIGSGRARLCALAVLAVLLLGDRGPTPPAPEPAAPMTARVDERGVAAALASVNPALDPRTLTRIGAAVVRYSAEYSLDPGLVTAVIRVESSARPWARSPKGAIGLMQVMPYMIAPMGLAGNTATIESNIQAGCAILADNIHRLGEERGISAYFWGSKIRGVAYLEKVRRAREELRRPRAS